MTIGDLIRKRRDILGMTGDDLKEASGITPSFLSRVENDASEPGLQLATRLAKALRLPQEEVLNGFGMTTPPQRNAAIARLAKLVGEGVTYEVQVVDDRLDPTGEVMVVELPKPEDAFLYRVPDGPWKGDVVASRSRKPSADMDVLVVRDGRLSPGTYRTAGTRRYWVDMPDGTRIDYPEVAFVIVRKG